MRLLRFAAGYLAIAAAVPYFVLKVIWLTGGTTGFNPDTPVSGEFDALNAATFAMDAAAIAVALALTHGWGRHLPAPLVLFPMWVGTGFLATIAIAVPISVVAAAVQGLSLLTADGGIVQPWVYAMVYAGFITQGIALLTAFALYTRDRWPILPHGEETSIQRLLATTGAVMAFGLGLAHLAWATNGEFYPRVMNTVFALLSMAGGAGILMMMRTRKSWTALVLAWVGSATNFSWGLWVTVNALMDSPLNDNGNSALGLVSFARVLAGMLIGMVAATSLSRGSVKVEG